MSASLAYIMGLPSGCVPNFIKHSDNEDVFWQMIDNFLLCWGFRLQKTKSKRGLTLVYGQCAAQGDDPATPHVYVERDGKSVFNVADPITEVWGRFKLVPIND
jgi:hypothetical protein